MIQNDQLLGRKFRVQAEGHPYAKKAGTAVAWVATSTPDGPGLHLFLEFSDGVIDRLGYGEVKAVQSRQYVDTAAPNLES